MDLLKKSLIALILFLVVVLAWVGTSIYYSSMHAEVNPNASSYTKSIKNSFDSEELKYVTDKTEAGFSISPSEFLNLTKSSD
jgi:uncharacterized protein (UPF0333 family)